jgi:inhibitor of KinA sporulation pathway (predicted exonuclease)
MRFIALDTEIEQPYTREDTKDSATIVPKLIQVGIVVFEIAEDEPVIIHSETMNINYNYPLSAFIKTLTSITDEDVNESENSALDAVTRLRNLQQLFGTSRQLVEWGSGDVTFITEQAELTETAMNSVYGFARSTINVKVLYQVYAMMNGKKRQGGLSASMNKVGLQFKGTRYKDKNKGKHWAEADALNTARIFNRLCNLYKTVDNTSKNEVISKQDIQMEEP